MGSRARGGDRCGTGCVDGPDIHRFAEQHADLIASIPLSILTSIACLHLAGQTINTMTLGGIALAVGMLVDDATVEVENIPSQSRDEQAAAGRHPRRRPSDRHADVHRHAFYLHRVFPGGAADRRRQISVYSARAGSRIRDADLVPVVAHAGADDGLLHVAGFLATPARRRSMTQATQLSL